VPTSSRVPTSATVSDATESSRNRSDPTPIFSRPTLPFGCRRRKSRKCSAPPTARPVPRRGPCCLDSFGSTPCSLPVAPSTTAVSPTRSRCFPGRSRPRAHGTGHSRRERARTPGASPGRSRTVDGAEEYAGHQLGFTHEEAQVFPRSAGQEDIRTDERGSAGERTEPGRSSERAKSIVDTTSWIRQRRFGDFGALGVAERGGTQAARRPASPAGRSSAPPRAALVRAQGAASRRMGQNGREKQGPRERRRDGRRVQRATRNREVPECGGTRGADTLFSGHTFRRAPRPLRRGETGRRWPNCRPTGVRRTEAGFTVDGAARGLSSAP